MMPDIMLHMSGCRKNKNIYKTWTAICDKYNKREHCTINIRLPSADRSIPLASFCLLFQNTSTQVDDISRNHIQGST